MDHCRIILDKVLNPPRVYHHFPLRYSPPVVEGKWRLPREKIKLPDKHIFIVSSFVIILALKKIGNKGNVVAS